MTLAARLKLSAPVQIDVSVADLVRAAAGLWSRRPATMPGTGVAALSVRSAFDRLLTVWRWPAGSEVLMSALTIHDMPRIVGWHDLRPVAVDVDATTMLPTLAALRAAVTPRTRAIVVTPLFGIRHDLTAIAAFAKEHRLVLIEDCAQAFDGACTVSPHADATFFSFGPIKRRTALGGAIIDVRDPDVRAALQASIAELPQTSASWFAARILRVALLKTLASAPTYGALDLCLTALGHDGDRIMYKWSRGFRADDLRSEVRRRLHPAHARFLARRLARVDRTDAAIDDAVEALQGSTLTVLGRGANHQAHWLVATTTSDPTATAAHLRHHGVAASAHMASIGVIGNEDSCPQATAIRSGLLCLRPTVSNLHRGGRALQLSARAPRTLASAFRAAVRSRRAPAPLPRPHLGP